MKSPEYVFSFIFTMFNCMCDLQFANDVFLFFFLCPYMILLCQSLNIEERYYHTKHIPWCIQMKYRETLEDKTIFFGILPRKVEKYTFWYNSHQSILVYSLKKRDSLKTNVL